MMLPPRRLRQILRFATPLLLLAVGLDILLGALARQPFWDFVPKDQSGRQGNVYFEAIQQQIDEAEAWYELGRVEDDRPLCVIFGLSTVTDGFNVDRVDQEDGVECRYLFLGGAGGAGIHDFAMQAEPLIESPLQPDLVILGFHPFYLAVPPYDEGDADRGVKGTRASQSARDSDPFTGVHRTPWIVRRRKELFVTFDGLLRRGRQWLLEKEQDREGPFGQPPYTPHFAVAVNEDRRDRFEERGWYDLQTYLEYYESSMALLIEVIDRLEAKGARVALIMMPENRVARESFPPEVRKMINESLNAHFPEDSVPILDFNDVLPEGEFRDHVHPNEYGRTRLSQRLAREIPRLLPEPTRHRTDGKMTTHP